MIFKIGSNRENLKNMTMTKPEKDLGKRMTLHVRSYKKMVFLDLHP